MVTLYHDKPWSQGAENVLKRAKQFMDVEWTPIKPLPSVYKFVGPDGNSYAHGYFSKWRPQKGLPYSSCRMVEKYLGWNISIETFFSALQNPNSVVYTRSLKDYPGRGMHCYYGIVCSMYVSYALQLPYRQACKLWTALPTVKPVDTTELENIRLCDIVLDPTHHVAIVTDILRDVNGKVHSIEVSEAVMPTTERKSYTPDEFRKYWLEDGYSIHRYDLVDEVTYEPNPFVYVEGDPILPKPVVNTSLMLDFGNRANYRIGDEPVEISVFEDGWDQIEVTDPNGETELFPIEDGKLVLNPAVAGFYSACLYKDGQRSDSIQWCMVDIEVKFEKDNYKFGDTVNFSFKNAAAEDTVFHFVLNSEDYYVQDSFYFSEKEIAEGKSTIPMIPGPGKYNILLFAKNSYGIYTSKYTDIIIE